MSQFVQKTQNATRHPLRNIDKVGIIAKRKEW
jgi:hypothetical protein